MSRTVSEPPPHSGKDRPPNQSNQTGRNRRRVLRTFLSVGLFLIVTGLIGAVWVTSRIQKPGPLTTDQAVLITKGMSVRDVADALTTHGVIDSPALFVVQAVVRDVAHTLKAGEFIFPPGISLDQTLSLLQSGQVVQYDVTIPEGQTVVEVIARLQAHDALTGQIKQIPADGSLLPETYAVPRGYARDDLVARMQQAMQSELSRLWANRSDRSDMLKTPRDAVILASIIEKETGVAGERHLVSGVFHNRLRRGMRLQSDPTVAYGLTGGTALDRSLTRADLKSRTPYNTYVIPALPPGPITNPGRAALEAALNPAETDYIYFVADGTGGHAFAKTLAEHNRNVAAWRRVQKQ